MDTSFYEHLSQKHPLLYHDQTVIYRNMICYINSVEYGVLQDRDFVNVDKYLPKIFVRNDDSEIKGSLLMKVQLLTIDNNNTPHNIEIKNNSAIRFLKEHNIDVFSELADYSDGCLYFVSENSSIH